MCGGLKRKSVKTDSDADLRGLSIVGGRSEQQNSVKFEAISVRGLRCGVEAVDRKAFRLDFW